MSRVCDLTYVGVLTGNKVSHSAIKTKRKFFPNLQNVSLKSDALGLNFNLRIATKTLRTINKYGSLDSFLVNYGHNKLSEKGRQLKKMVVQRLLTTEEYENVKVLKHKKVS
ncbi:MAG: 50S ribosomal protein L28 [Rickettsiales bacterium]|jgi:large subunit ribosomal protein L28|nr:50S ribosomal protein L28 [Rickettsiales bacterium]